MQVNLLKDVKPKMKEHKSRQCKLVGDVKAKGCKSKK